MRMALRSWRPRCSVTVGFWNLSGFCHALKLLFELKSLIPCWKDEREISFPDSPLAVTWCMSQMPYILSQFQWSQNQCVNAFLRYQGRWCLDGRQLVDLAPEWKLIELLTSLLEVGSSRMCCETPFGVFKQMRVKLTFYHLVELANSFSELKNWWHTLTARLMVCLYLNKHAGNPSTDGM